MFQSLRPNSQIFVLHRGEPVSVEVGFVSNMSLPKPKYPMQVTTNTPQEVVVDMDVKLNSGVVKCYGVNASADVAESFSNGENITIATSKEALNSKILSLRQESIDIVSSVDMHKKLITDYDKVINDLNPELAEKEQQKNEIKALKEQVSQMTQNVAALMQANQALIEKLNRKET